MNKLIVYLRYLYQYLKFGDLISIAASFRYVVSHKSHKSDRVIRTSIGTFFCRKNTNDFQYANYAYEWTVKKFILEHYNDYNVFIDGGACVGEYSIMLANKNLKCFAFEPVTQTFEVLTKNLELNQLTSKIKAFPFGLGVKNEHVNFVFDPINTGASHMAEVNQTGDLSVEIRTFDSVYPTLGLHKDDCILFKLDVERMEPAALWGAQNFIREYPNITFVLEDKRSGEHNIKATLNAISNFEFGKVDRFNIYAKKSGNHK